jgi:hypothetical protein
VDYNVPLKDRKKINLCSLNWPLTLTTLKDGDFNQTQYKFLETLDSMNDIIPYGSESKYLNTIDFFNYCQPINQEYFKGNPEG